MTFIEITQFATLIVVCIGSFYNRLSMTKAEAETTILTNYIHSQGRVIFGLDLRISKLEEELKVIKLNV